MASYLPLFKFQSYPSNEHLSFIEFRHFEYSFSHSLLLRIACVDGLIVTELLKTHHKTVLVALQIIVDNVFKTDRFMCSYLACSGSSAPILVRNIQIRGKKPLFGLLFHLAFPSFFPQTTWKPPKTRLAST